MDSSAFTDPLINEPVNRFRREMRIKSKHNTECLFGNTKISTFKPYVTIPVSTIYLIEICKTLINELKDNCDVEIQDGDLSTLIIVTVLQIEAKVRMATKSSSFDMDNELDSRAMLFKDTFPVSLFPLSFYVDQIGKLVIQGQTIIPQLIDLKNENISQYTEKMGFLPLNIISLPEGNFQTGGCQWVRIIDQPSAIALGIIEQKGSELSLTKEYLEDSTKFDCTGIIFTGPPRIVAYDYQELSSLYFNFIDRVNKRLSNAFAQVDYDEAKGTAAQLVTSKLLDFDQNITMYKVWSTRFVDDDALEVGGLLQFGFELGDSHVSRSEEFRCCEAFVEAQSPLMEFVRKVKKFKVK